MENRALFSFAALSLALTILASASMPVVAQAQRAIVVTSTANDGPGTLRQALLDAVNGDTITFDPIVFPPDSPATITLTNALPEITQGNLTIDASNAGVILDGSGLSGGDGFLITSDGNVIKGLQILNFPAVGIWIAGHYNLIGGNNASPGGVCSGECNLVSDNGEDGVIINNGMNNTVSGNYIGTDIDGTTSLSNAGNGVQIEDGARYNRIGGGTASERNLISGNSRSGVRIEDIGTSSNVVSGNYIGTDATGTMPIGNLWQGIDCGNHGQNNLIGGSNASPGGACSGECNLISGNGDNGVWIGDVGTRNNAIMGNYIGTDVSGTAAIPNGVSGVSLAGSAQNNLIGGNTAAERNLISGNTDSGVNIGGSGVTDNVVSGNYIGTDASGRLGIGNGLHGIAIGDGAQSNLIGGSNASPGGVCSGDCNLIGGNSESGLRIVGSGTMSNIVSGNYIGTDATGTRAIPNARNGVEIYEGPRHNLIGGEAPGERNVISGNSDNGVQIESSDTISNTVSGNFIGTDARGMGTLGNAMAGIAIKDGAQRNVVGGTTAGERNIISGNSTDHCGVCISGAGTDHNRVMGNYIGTDADGTIAMGNGHEGIWISDGAKDNIIGGPTEGERNLISGNGETGIRLSDTGTVSNIVSGNYIGTDATGTRAIPNARSGVSISDGARHNLIGGVNGSPGGVCSGACNVISSNGNIGVSLSGSDTMSNTVSGNYIGTDASGTAELGNSDAGVWIREGASDNAVGPGNVIAYNGGPGIQVWLGGVLDSVRNTLSQNAIYDNAGKAIDISNYGRRAQLPIPQITRVGFRIILGNAPPNSTVEIFSDDGNDAQYYEGSTIADEAGAFVYLVPRDGFTEQYITGTATDEGGTTSELSDPTPAEPRALYELPGILTPSEVSLEPEVIGMNLSLALVSVLVFGGSAMVFNSTMEKHSSEVHAAVERALPQRLGKWLRPKTLTSKGQIVLRWIALLVLTSLIESFLDTRPLGMTRISIFLALFLAAIATNGLETGSDLLIRRRLVPHSEIQYRTHWIGLIIAADCVILSRAMNFQPGYLYGTIGALTHLPKLSDRNRAGKRALVVLLAVLGGGLLAWLLSPLVAPISADLEALLLTIFIISLEGVFFALLPITVTDGGDIWQWNKWYWLLFATGVSFIFHHTVLTPRFEEVELLRQNSVQTVLVLFAIFGGTTLGLWLFFRFRLWRAKNK